MKNLLAVGNIQIAPNNGFTGFGPLGTNVGNGIGTFTNFVSTTIGLMTIIAIVWFIFTFILGAIGIISSGGDKNALESAKKKITTSLIGLVVVIVAVFIIDLIGYLLGFSGATSFLNLPSLFNLISK